MLAQAGYEFVGYDYKGHGNSEGMQYHLSSFEAHMSDARTFVQLMKTHYQGLPFVASGHSLGGGTSICLSLLTPELIEGLMLTAPVTVRPDGLPYPRLLATLAHFFPFKRSYFPNDDLEKYPLLQYSVQDKLFKDLFIDFRTVAAFLEMYSKYPERLTR